MPCIFNWASIRSPQTYENLIGTLLAFEYPDFARYSRPGRDAGIDGQSGGGTSIWQFKFHSKPTLARVIADARDEFAQIAARRQSDHAENRLWSKCTQWTLVTNFDFNPQSAGTLADAIADDFMQLGIEARFWGNADVEPLLVRHRQVAEHFFEGKSRAFLLLDEAKEEEGIIRFGKLDVLPQLIGREDDLRELNKFLTGNDALFLIHGAGAVGKSRFLLEAGDRAKPLGFLPIWANASTMSRNDAWMQAFQHYDQALLLIDEPTDPDLIETLAEQFRSGPGLKKWKFIIAARSPKDPILEAARTSTMPFRERALEPLPGDRAREVATELLTLAKITFREETEKSAFADQIARAADGYPGWMVLAVETIQSGQPLADLPTSKQDLAAKYVSEILRQDQSSHLPRHVVHELLRWIALFERFDLENNSLVEFLRQRAGIETLGQFDDCIRSLTKRRVLIVRGIRKHHRLIKPDVIRDYLLKDWLVDSTGDQPAPSTAARQLINDLLRNEQAKAIPEIPQVLKAMAQLDLRETLMDRRVDLLAPVFEELAAEANRGDANHQATLVALLNNIAFARADLTIAICRTIRTSPSPPATVESIFGKRTIEHAAVVRGIPWLLFETARYIREPEEQRALLVELCELLKFEVENPEPMRRNDGKRAEDVIPRIISSRTEVIWSYEEVGYTLATEALKRMAQSDPSPAEIEVVEALTKHFISVEREDTTFSGTQFNITRWLIQPDSGAWQKRDALLSELRRMVTTTTIPSIRLQALRLLAESAQRANRALIETRGAEDRLSATRAAIVGSLQSLLEWTSELVSSGRLNFQELSACRTLWSWHAEYGPPGTLRDIALQCEAVYDRHPMTVAYGAIYDQLKFEESVEAAKRKADEFATSGTSQQIAEFLRGADEYQNLKRGGGGGGSMGYFANALGAYFMSSVAVRDFCLGALNPDSTHLELTVSLISLSVELKRLRMAKDEPGLKALLDQISSRSTAPRVRAEAIRLFYGFHPDSTGPVTETDFRNIESAIKDPSLPMTWPLRFSLCSNLIAHQPERGLDVLKTMWEVVPPDEKIASLTAFADNVGLLFHMARQRPEVRPTPATFDWMVDRLVELPNIDELNDNLWYHYQEMAQFMRKRPLKWLNDVLQARMQQAPTEDEGWKILSSRHRLTKFVETINSQNAGDPAIEAEVSQLLDLGLKTGLVGYLLPEYAVRIDPEGLLIPRLLADRIEATAATDEDVLHRWLRFAGYYAFNLEPWRRIATAALRKIQELPEKERGGHYAALLPAGIRSVSYAAGQMNPQPAEFLKARKEEKAKETDPEFLPFREWNLQVAEAEYKHALAEFNEEQASALD